MTRREEIEQQAMKSYPDCPERGFGTGDYEYPEFHDDEREAFIEGAKWADKTMIEKACRCYCDDICDKGRCCMCFHKHDGKGQVKNDFQYNECNELKLIRKAMEE